MKEAVQFEPEGKLSRALVEYRWTSGAGSHVVKLTTTGRADSADAYAWEMYLVRRPYRYSVNARGETCMSVVEHLPWFYWETASVSLEGPMPSPFVRATPDSALLVKGSPVALSRPRKI